MIFFCADIGTTTLKAAAITETGSVIFFTHLYSADFAGTCESLRWQQAFESASRLYISKGLPQPDTICISGNGPTLTAIDSNGNAFFTYLWNQPSAFLDSLTGKKELAMCQSIFIPRILALKNDYPKIYHATTSLLSGPDFLVYTLTGIKGTAIPAESYIPSYWQKDDYHRYLLDDKKLMPFHIAGTRAGTITVEAANRTGFAEGTTVLWGLPDFLAALTGTGTVTPGIVCDRAGTSEGINICVADKPMNPDPHLRILPSIIPGLWNISYLIPDSGKRFAEFMQQPEAVAIGWDPMIKAIATMFDDLHQIPSQHIVKEGGLLIASLTKEIAVGLSIFKKEGFPITEIRMCGGQAKNKYWRALKSRLTGVQITVPQCADAELLGNAVIAAVSTGCYATITKATAAMITLDRIDTK